jgi:tetratricopeptide (TPR) repeat protein
MSGSSWASEEISWVKLREALNMNLSGGKLAIALGLALTVLGAGAAPVALTQTTGQSTSTQTQESVNAMETQLHIVTDVQRQSGVDPKETAAYESFYQANSDEPDEKIKLGMEFSKKYPHSPYTEAIDAGLTSAYFVKQDWKNFYAFADKTLAMNPDEIDVLTVVGWVIPHQYDPNDPSATQRLSTAEDYEKRALDLLAKLTKPKGVSDTQFAAMKVEKEEQAHSALGLVNFRRGDYANSVTELRQATQGTANADQTDLYVLGVDLQNLNQHADAAAAFTRCSQIVGPLQGHCKESADQESKLAHGGK